jgi:hypothetical protein
MKRHWGRLLWVTITDGPICVFSVYLLLTTYQQQILYSVVREPVWAVFYDNPIFVIAFALAGTGLLLEALNRREAGVINCSFWLAFSIYSFAQHEPTYSTAVVALIFVADLIWYFLPSRRNSAGNPRLDSSGP